MARSRNIKPSFFKNEDLAELAYEARLLFIGTWTLADREGRLEDRPKKIKMEIFPADSVDVEKLLQKLHDAKFILRYEVAGKRYIQVVAFPKHQNPHHREPPSTIPPATESLGLTVDAKPKKPEAERPSKRVEASGSPRASPADSGFLIPESRGKTTLPPSGAFVRFWTAWPKNDRKQAKGKCWEAWRKASLDQQADAILAHVERLKGSDGWRRGFVPAPLVYLNQRRWEGADDAAPPAELKLAI